MKSALSVVEVVGGADDETGVRVVIDEPAHEVGGGVIMLAARLEAESGERPRQKLKGLGSLSNQTSSGRKTWDSRGDLIEPPV